MSGIAPLADLHLHTLSSDGDFSEKAVIDMLCKTNVRVAAFTDHDELATANNPVLWRYLEKLGDKAPQIVPGVEIDCSLKEPIFEGGPCRLHIVGLGVDPHNVALKKALIRQRLGTAQRTRDCINKLNGSTVMVDGKQKTIEVRYGDLGITARTRAVSHATIPRTIADLGYARSYSAARYKIVEPRLADYRTLPQRFTMDAQDAIALIHAAGGVAILAHPHRVTTNNQPKSIIKLLEQFKAQGLDAAEAHRADLKEQLRPIYAECIDKVGLLRSGGSDFHYVRNRRFPGDSNTPLSLWGPLEKLIKQRGGVTNVLDLRAPKVTGANASERLFLSQS